MWEKESSVWDEGKSVGRKAGNLVAVLPSRKADVVIICNNLEMLGTVSVTGKDSFN